jgi:hypothetical protein
VVCVRLDIAHAWCGRQPQPAGHACIKRASFPASPRSDTVPHSLALSCPTSLTHPL